MKNTGLHYGDEKKKEVCVTSENVAGIIQDYLSGKIHTSK